MGSLAADRRLNELPLAKYGMHGCLTVIELRRISKRVGAKVEYRIAEGHRFEEHAPTAGEDFLSLLAGRVRTEELTSDLVSLNT